MSDARSKQARLEALRQAYGASLGQRLATIRETWSHMRRHPQDCRRHLEEFHRQVHTLAGSAGTFGYQRLSSAARNLEALLSETLCEDQLQAGAATAEIEGYLADLQVIADAGADRPQTSCQVGGATTPRRNPQQVFLIEDDATQASETTAQLEAYGWQIKCFSTANEARKALRSALPAAVIVDQVLPEGRLAGSELLHQVKALARYRVPRILISSRWDWQSRLTAAQAGADAYVVKPLDYIELAETLDKLTEKTDREPYRVLIVEDTVELAEHYAQVLELAGMRVASVSDPSKLLDVLNDFKPELILMDLYMPGCSGVDAARVIRQDPEYLSVPIVFLSTEAARNRQLAALENGADDFLQKPIDDKMLVSAVRIRAERFRSLAEQIHCDSLTGLLNHIAFKLQLEAEHSRSLRTGSPLTFAMLDIDHFKQVNDTYGHPVGDRVIRGVSTLLTKRLRKSDFVGRYGGEEFAVLMCDTPLPAALAVLDEIREQIGQMTFNSDGREFRCTVSIGVASAADFATPEALIEAADHALYRAKHAGRNRVCTAEAPEPGAAHVGRSA